MAHENRIVITSERATLDPFDALAGDRPPRDQRDLMERPFFSLAKAKRVKPIPYKTGDTEVQVYVVPEHGMATIWDTDVLICAASQTLAAQERGLPTSRFFCFTPCQFLIAIGHATGSREYQLLKGGLTRLQSTVIRTAIRRGEYWRPQRFSWINVWQELTTRSSRCEGMEFVLMTRPFAASERIKWFDQGVLERRLVLTIDAAYFTLSGGIERRLYRVARKHDGHQPEGWRFELKHLHAKSTGLARFSDFALDIRRLVARQALRGYALALERHDDGRELIVMRPAAFTFPVGIPCKGSVSIGISGASLSGLRRHASQRSLCTQNQRRAPKDSESESKSSSVGRASHRGKWRSGPAPDRGGAS